jgi:hypothetical protein
MFFLPFGEILSWFEDFYNLSLLICILLNFDFVNKIFVRTVHNFLQSIFKMVSTEKKPKMIYRSLGRSGLKVSVLALGGW